MAELDIRGQLTLIELAKRTNNKELLTIAEVLNQDNEFIQDAVWVEANDITSHVYTRRASLPTGSWRRINEGVAEESSSTIQVREPIGILEAFSKVDCFLVDNAPNPVQFRTNEDMAFVEGLGQNMVEKCFYGNIATDPEQINGLSIRGAYNTIADANVWAAGGTESDLASIWIIQWGANKVHLVYPRGSQSMGVKRTDLGRTVAYDSSYNPYMAYWSNFVVNIGLVIRDDRNVQRIVNIETAGSSNIFDDDLLIKALNHMPGRGAGASIYMNETMLSQMDIRAKDKSNVDWQPGEAFGAPVTLFKGHVVRKVDQLLTTETAIT
ncbi:MAG: hypothetical protein Q7J85_05490 [Bacillota bacterium]|nr:hypothetical protein [Bacillota bacterium]